MSTPYPEPVAARPSLYFRAGGRLDFDPPSEDAAEDSWVSDPAKPVPVVGYTAQTIPDEYMQ